MWLWHDGGHGNRNNNGGTAYIKASGAKDDIVGYEVVNESNYTKTYPIHILKVRKHVAPSSNNNSSNNTSVVFKKVVNTSSHWQNFDS